MIVRWLVVLIYLVVIIYDIRAELLCLRVLGGDQSLGGHAGEVQNAVLWSFAAVALIPIAPVFIRMQSLRRIKQVIGCRLQVRLWQPMPIRRRHLDTLIRRDE